jgi:hypothetical protein
MCRTITTYADCQTTLPGKLGPAWFENGVASGNDPFLAALVV